ncbi:hypothetical protein [Rubinisphaera margarita]|uniref:hypothetical protein n=1 Tax=Rubinisphaera margarita TaxID=2909586 RepID=UPI001EE8AF1C|nr:hypothetical protein [Rubinisphaera margarita]MCG6155187.1 hypothetical protein [Rubinisphaera margarita]
MKSLALSALLLGSLSLTAVAKEPATKPVFSDQFERSEKNDQKEEVGNGWTTNSKGRAKGDKQVDLKDGTLVVNISPQADHAVTVKQVLDLSDCCVRFRFQLGPKDQLAFNFSDLQLKTVHAGHIASIKVNTNRLSVEDQKYGTMELDRYKRRKAGEDPKKLREEVADFVKAEKISLEPDVWHEMEIVIEGDTCTATVDGKHSVTHQSPGYGHPVKRHVAFSVPKNAVIDDVRIWDVAKP